MGQKIKNIITKATLKSERCEVSFQERFVEENYTNEVNKRCDQIIHDDLRQAFLFLRPFLVTITEQPEASLIDTSNIDEQPDEELEKELAKYYVTGYARKGVYDNASVMLVGQKMLKSGQALDLETPYIKFSDSDEEAFPFRSELLQAIERCDWEITEYLFNGKHGFKQQQLDFDSDVPQEAIIEEKPKKKSGRGKKKKEEEIVFFDRTA